MNTKPIFITLILAAILFAGCSSANKNNNVRPSATATSDQMTKTFEKNLPDGFARPTDDVGVRLLGEYGSVFVARGGAVVPKTVVFKGDAEVAAFQSSLRGSKDTVGGVEIELQSAAMSALKEAATEAVQNKLTITPRGADSAKRSYEDTVGLWKSRVEPGLTHWVRQGRITAADAERIRAFSPFDQVPEILKLESQGMFFAKDLSKSIIYSVAPPGSSQHLSMLALDVTEHDNSQVRSILAKHGWYQTVVSDLPHFTFLGEKEDSLAALGLKRTESGNRVFWVPDI